MKVVIGRLPVVNDLRWSSLEAKARVMMLEAEGYNKKDIEVTAVNHGSHTKYYIVAKPEMYEL